MQIAIVGLGLIGGSLAKALKKYTDHHIIGLDTDASVLEEAVSCRAIDVVGVAKDLAGADLIFFCVYPDMVLPLLQSYTHYFKKGAIVTDTAGVKTPLCAPAHRIAQKNGFSFIGGHPMAGKELGGFQNSDARLFHGASYIFTPLEVPAEDLNMLRALAIKIGFAQSVITTPQIHDDMIAYTSQVPHVLACSYVSNPRAKKHDGFSAGSFQDVSRVAKINMELWSELFVQNSDALCGALEDLITRLGQFKEHIGTKDKTAIFEMLAQANHLKEELML